MSSEQQPGLGGDYTPTGSDFTTATYDLPRIFTTAPKKSYSIPKFRVDSEELSSIPLPDPEPSEVVGIYIAGNIPPAIYPTGGNNVNPGIPILRDQVTNTNYGAALANGLPDFPSNTPPSGATKMWFFTYTSIRTGGDAEFVAARLFYGGRDSLQMHYIINGPDSGTLYAFSLNANSSSTPSGLYLFTTEVQLIFMSNGRMTVPLSAVGDLYYRTFTIP